jgi:hypothetical protein
MTTKFVASVLLGSLALAAASACGSTGRETQAADAPPTTPEPSSSGDLSSGGASGSLGGASSSGATPPDAGLQECASETQKAEGAPLDIFVMLDASGSMMAEASGGVTKWQAVKTALGGFVAAPTSSGIGVGLGVFPVKHAGAPASCTSNAECTVGGTSYGRCFLKACDSSASSAALSCDTSADCPGAAPCRQIGFCKQGIFSLGDCLVGAAGACLIGSCTPLTTSSCDGAQCFAGDYTTPKVPIATLPGNASALSGTISALPDPSPDALTPTSSAITGGLAIAKQYATSQPGHSVVLVLATDGLPTRCAPLDIAAIANLTAAGRTGSPGVKTFVIGVFSSDEASTAKPNLDAIAAAGGTTSAFIANTNGNLTQDFQAALDKIRGNALPCDYTVPKPANGTPDYEKVNVELTSGSGKTLIANKKSAQGCDAAGGWSYDVDPSTGATPTKIVLCPATCDAVKQSSGAAQVDIVLGCKTIVK